jgi:hypothetical protein
MKNNYQVVLLTNDRTKQTALAVFDGSEWHATNTDPNTPADKLEIMIKAHEKARSLEENKDKLRTFCQLMAKSIGADLN